MITAFALVMVGLGYLAGRLHGKAALHSYLAEGFRIMQRTAEMRGIPTYSQDAELWTAAEVSRAFGSGRETP